jgi:hypothetical protein
MNEEEKKLVLEYKHIDLSVRSCRMCIYRRQRTKMRCSSTSNKELTSISIRTGIRHTEHACIYMLMSC